MLPDRVLNPEPLTYESGALPIALHSPAPACKGIYGMPLLTGTSIEIAQKRLEIP